MMRPLVPLGPLLLALALVGCGDDDDSGYQPWDFSSPGSSASSPAPGLRGLAPPSNGRDLTVEELRAGIEWDGQFSMVIEVWDYCASFDELAMSASYIISESFSFSTAAPVDHGPAARETNPFFISAGTDPDVGGSVVLALQSTGVAALPGQEDEPYVLQYWQLEYADGHLTGKLVEDGRELGLAFNGFQDHDSLIACQPEQGTIVRPYPMKEGATLDAEIGAETVTVVLEGSSYDEARRWRVEATGTRSD